MKKTVLVVVATAVLVSACTTTDPYTGEQKVSNTAAGAGLGALAGAGIGLLAGGNDRRNALIGAGIGALAGGAIGATMDQNEAELRRQLQGTGVSVTRTGDQIILNMPSDITFNVDQDAVKPGFYPVLNSVALVLNKLPARPSSTCSATPIRPAATSTISICRSAARWSVANYLVRQGVDLRRFAVTGFGKTRPIASNAHGRAGRRTAASRSSFRR